MGGGYLQKEQFYFFAVSLMYIKIRMENTYEVESWNSGDFKMDSQLGWHCWVSLSLLSFCRLVRSLGCLLCPPDPTPKNTTSWALAFGLAAISLWAYTLKFLLQLFFMLFLLSPSFSLSAWHHRRHQRRKKDILQRKAKNTSKKRVLGRRRFIPLLSLFSRPVIIFWARVSKKKLPFSRSTTTTTSYYRILCPSQILKESLFESFCHAQMGKMSDGDAFI